VNVGAALKEAAQGILDPSKTARKVVKLAKAVHGNSKASSKLHHRYVIKDKETGEVQKTGISGQDLNNNGSSPRANKQVNQMNKDAGSDRFEATVEEKNIPGRKAALDSEQAATNRLANEGHKLPAQCRPRATEQNC
jgi:hypothetical protein